MYFSVYVTKKKHCLYFKIYFIFKYLRETEKFKNKIK